MENNMENQELNELIKQYWPDWKPYEPIPKNVYIWKPQGQILLYMKNHKHSVGEIHAFFTKKNIKFKAYIGYNTIGFFDDLDKAKLEIETHFKQSFYSCY